MDKKANHRVNIVRLQAPTVHANADTLELFHIEGYQVVTKKGNFKEGDLAVYIQPDSVVPEEPRYAFLWDAAKFEGQPVPERKRRVTVRRFRKEWSEGMLMPISDYDSGANFDGQWKQREALDGSGRAYVDFRNTVGGTTSIPEGHDVSDLLKITHWEGDDVETTQGKSDSRPRRKYPKTVKGWFWFLLFKAGITSAKKNMIEELAFDVPKFDVDSIKNYKNAIKPEDIVVVTEKIHGSQGRFFFREGKMYAGSRNWWKADDSPCVWRKVLRDQPWIETYCRENEGDILYTEVVPTQKNYRYGVEEGQSAAYVFDVRDGQTGDYRAKLSVMVDGRLVRVPVLFTGRYDEMPKDIENGKSCVPGAQNIREGVVITVLDPTRYEHKLGRIQLKLVSNDYLAAK